MFLLRIGKRDSYLIRASKNKQKMSNKEKYGSAVRKQGKNERLIGQLNIHCGEMDVLDDDKAVRDSLTDGRFGTHRKLKEL